MQCRQCEISGKQTWEVSNIYQFIFSLPNFIHFRNYYTIIHCSFTDDNRIINLVFNAKYLYNGICQNPELAELTSVKLREGTDLLKYK